MSGARDCPICGRRRISPGKASCLTCAETANALDNFTNHLKENPLVDNCTHIIVKHKDVDQEDLYRANGMLCASRHKDLVRFGTDVTTAQNRPFLNAEMASKFLRVMAEVDLVAQEKMLPIHAVIDTYVTLEKEPRAVIDERDISDLHSNLVLPVAKRLH